MSTIEAIKVMVYNNADAIALYALCSTLAVVAMMLSVTKSRKKYTTWKSQTINLGVWSATFERSDDELLLQLWDENQRLDSENKLLKQEKSDLTTKTLIILLVFLVDSYLRSLLKRR